jgi:hypothetical protein
MGPPLRCLVASLLAGSGAAMVLSGCGGGSDTATAPSTSPSPKVVTAPTSPGQVVTLPAGSRAHAVLRVVSGYSAIHLGTAPLAGGVVEASGVADAASAPALSVQGRTVVVSQPQGAASGPALDLRLARDVTWRIELDAGASSVRLDLSRGRVSAIDVTQGVSALAIALPAPRGTLPVTISGGASSVRLSVTGAVPVLAAMDGGAGSVRLYRTATTGVAGGSVLETPGWRGARNRLVVDCVAGVSSLVVR